MSVIEQLKSLGIKVHVSHFREKQYSFEVPKHVNRGIAATLVDVDYAARGGQTVVSLSLPNGVNVRGVSDCSKKDVFCRKTGREFAMKRAIEALVKLSEDYEVPVELRSMI